MARKAPVPPDQLARLRNLYSEQRQALVKLAASERHVEAAERAVSTAQQAVKDAKAAAEADYQALVELIGTTAAAELTGRTSLRRGNGSVQRPGGSDNGHHPHPHAVA